MPIEVCDPHSSPHSNPLFLSLSISLSLSLFPLNPLGAPPISNAPEVFLDLMDDLKKKDQVESVRRERHKYFFAVLLYITSYSQPIYVSFI